MLQKDASSLRAYGAPCAQQNLPRIVLPRTSRRHARDQVRNIAASAGRHMALAAALGTASRCHHQAPTKQSASLQTEDSLHQRSYGVDVLGLAQAMVRFQPPTHHTPTVLLLIKNNGCGALQVDYTAGVSCAMLNEPPFSVAKGCRRVITLSERAAVMERLDDEGCESEVRAGSWGGVEICTACAQTWATAMHKNACAVTATRSPSLVPHAVASAASDLALFWLLSCRYLLAARSQTPSWQSRASAQPTIHTCASPCLAAWAVTPLAPTSTLSLHKLACA